MTRSSPKLSSNYKYGNHGRHVNYAPNNHAIICPASNFTSEHFFSIFVCKMSILTSINSFLGCKMGEEWTVRTIGDKRDRSSVLCSSEGFHCRQNHHG